ncbi:hypothetical protein BZ13_814 [Francisella philomiragia subsp. philomiragia ATCC 25015]|uniref:hypothetical protein n=1 Tax=Francisella philomiragia TaxID=28110 RepID=UPI0001AF799E|nr:hypothetical protein [Francisella philomiragia]AJI75660.1 hypothetical protein BZ13_814 [Francisella philomiragia subsp. philomiragia ATCC 25015]EET20957.1 predicted protein [Francisella philomiragia subsp. philomiragia ATCC 25015]MBK2238645.1 hypothetical protein [Francisella philomiragia]
MIKKYALLISIAILSITASYALPQHAPDEEVCDMHAFTQYNKHLAFHNFHDLSSQISKLPAIGKLNSEDTIIQFCDFQSTNCLKNYKILSQVHNSNQDVTIYILTNNQDKTIISETLAKNGFDKNYISMYLQNLENINSTYDNLTKELKIDHIPSVYIMKTNATKLDQIYFSEHEQVPEYIIERALNYLSTNKDN